MLITSTPASCSLASLASAAATSRGGGARHQRCWGEIAWAVGAPDQMFPVLSVRTAPVHAALVSFPEPQYRNSAGRLIVHPPQQLETLHYGLGSRRLRHCQRFAASSAS
jgi:hypothetical protein